MPVFRVQEKVSIDLEKILTLRAKRNETEDQIAARAIKGLTVPKKVAKGFELSNVKFSAMVEEGDKEGFFDCTVYATLTAKGERKIEAIDPQTAREIANEEVYEIGSEASPYYFPFLKDSIPGGWSYESDEITHDVIGVLTFRREPTATSPVI